jgi:cytochrome c oxidase cbb3-type subunit 4
MDITDFRSLATVLCAIAFTAVVWWAYGPSRKDQFEEAAKLPFLEDDETAGGKRVAGKTDERGRS